MHDHAWKYCTMTRQPGSLKALFASAASWSGAALALALSASLVAVIYPTFDYDLYWHLANGRAMWEQGRIVEQDIFSFTRAGAAYRNPEWLAQLIFYGLWSFGGMLALFLFKLAVAVAVVLLSWRTLRALNAAPWAAAVAIALAVLTGFYRYIERPELFSLLGAAASIAVIICSREAIWSRRVLYVLPLVMAVWEWLHGAVFGMTLLAGAVFAENLAARWRPSTATAARAQWRATLNRAALATVVVSLLNPYGLSNYGIFAPVIADSAGFSGVNEWAPPGLRDYWLFFILFGAGLLGLCWQRKAEHLVEFCWLLGFGVLACRYSRVTGVFAIAALPWFAVAYARFAKGKVSSILLGAAALLLAAGLYIHKFSPWSFVERRFAWQVLEDFLPAGSVRFALDLAIQGPLYNSGHFGGYLAFKLYPAHRIFQYNLPAVWGETYLHDPSVVRRYDINWAIIGRADELQRMFPPNAWAYLFMDGASVLAVRRSPENAELIRQFQVQFFHPDMGPERLAERLAHAATGERLAFEAAVYCAYRRNVALCSPLLSHLSGSASPYAWAAQWLPKVVERQARAQTR